MKSKNEAVSPLGANRNIEQKQHHKDNEIFRNWLIFGAYGFLIGIVLALYITAI